MLIFTKVRDVRSPRRATAMAGGIDIFTPIDMQPIEIEPHSGAKIPSGLRFVIPIGKALIAYNKSGVSTSKLLVKTAEFVDADYSGEVHIAVLNASNETIILQPDTCYIQFALQTIDLDMPHEISNEAYDNYTASYERGDKGFGTMTDKY